MTHDERQKLIHLPIRRGILSTVVHNPKPSVSGGHSTGSRWPNMAEGRCSDSYRNEGYRVGRGGKS